eukprot:5123485-Pleurochrysis_carterae.AAC.2
MASRLARKSGAPGRAEEVMRRWKRAFDMGNLRRGRRASWPWSATNCCCSPSTARRRCSALTMSLPARRCTRRTCLKTL